MKTSQERDIQTHVDRAYLRINSPTEGPIPELSSYGEENQPALPEIPPLRQVANIPLSFSQKRLWFLNQYNPDNAAYSSITAWELSGGTVNIALLEKSITEILRRHSVLRSVLHSDDDNYPFITFLSPMVFSLPVVDLLGFPSEQREATAREAIIRDARLPFVLDQGPLFRATLYRLEPQRHWFVFTYHHIIMDGWSAKRFIEELQTLYQAFTRGEPSPLPELSIDYSDVAAWQRSWYTGKTLQHQLEYWLQQLKGPLPILDLPADHPRQAFRTDHGGVRRTMLLPHLLQRIQGLCIQLEVTPFVFLLAAFQLLLHHYSGQPDLIVGTPVTNRKQPETETLIGQFTNTLPLRTDLSGATSFLDLLRLVRETALQAFTHQDVPFEAIIDALHPDHQTSHTPIFQVLFSLQDSPLHLPEIDGLRFNPLVIDQQTARYDLSLSLVEGLDGLNCELEYNSDIFKAATVDRMLGHYRQILEAVCADPQQTLHAIPLLTTAERQQIIYQWNNTGQPVPQQTIYGLFEAQAHRTPDAVAVCYEQEQITYQQLDRRATQLARYLITKGVGPEVLVGVSLHRSIDVVVGLLAILKAGGAYMPLDPNFPEERLAYMLEDSGAHVMLTQSSLAGRLTGQSIQVVCIDTDWPDIARQSAEMPGSGGAPDNLAYVLYTSGSTGKPKGVQVLQHSVVNFLTAMQREPGITAEDVLLSVTTLSFDIAGLEVYLPLISGAKIVLANSAVLTDGARLSKLMEEHQVTLMQATPATWRLMINAGWMGNDRLKILCGGEAFPTDLVAPLLQRCGSLWNMYGPTETTIWSTLMQITSSDEVITIGRPIANTSVYLLDTHKQPVPVGIPGELYIGGVGVARGYLNRSELTAERFLPNPFCSQVADPSYPNDRFYRTGDLCRWLPDGRIEYLGRIDNQVKLRGFRIELGEIEAVLSQHPAVHQVVVIAREDIPGDKRLVAYLTVQTSPAPSTSELRAYLRGSLPEYMIPAAFVVMQSLPLTLNGKVDRRALPAPEMSRPELVTRFAEPRNEVERTLAAIWQESLKVDKVGINDNFFDLGGDSIRLLAMLSDIEDQFGKKVPINIFFQAATIAELARLLTEEKKEANWNCLVPIQPRGNKTPLFCIHAEGAAFFYHPLALALGLDQPVYGLQALGLDGKTKPLSRVEDMATLYIQEIRTVQPHGPYQIAGYQMGGIIALEIAHQLRVAGEEVGLVALIETYGHNYPVMDTIKGKLGFKLWVHVKRIRARAGSLGGLLEYIKTILVRGTMNFTALWLGPVLLRLKLPLPQFMRYEVLRRSIDLAVRAYKSAPYDGVVTLFRATRQPAIGIPDRFLGLQPLISSEIRVVDVEATHLSIVEETDVKNLAQLLQTDLLKG